MAQPPYIVGSSAAVLLFTGHRIDEPDRPIPRFPARREALARKMIQGAVRQELARFPAGALGFAGGASGGDILFHEVCRAEGLKSVLCLALSKQAYVEASVETQSEGQWVSRFHQVARNADCRYLPHEDTDSDRARSQNDSDVWQRCNAWMFNEAVTTGNSDTTLLALWNGQTGDGPGGTSGMIALARSHATRIIVLDAQRLIAD